MHPLLPYQSIPRSFISLYLLLGLGLAVVCRPARAQVQANAWALGRSAGVSFATGQAAAVQGISALYQPGEGGSAMADDQGRLLMYTDGEQVYNRLHAVVPGSAGLGGHVSSSQSALFVRQPGSITRYWLFTTDAIERYPNQHRGLRYTVLDATLNGGLGGVVPGQFSIQLQAQTAEKLTACLHANGQDVWVMGHGMGNANFYAWRLTATGLESATPVTSTAGTPHTGVGAGDNNPGRGCMKLSPTGSHLAAVVLPPTAGKWLCELFRFDNNTGRLTLQEDLSEPTTDRNGYNYYGVEFSPSGQRLYISSQKGPYNIFQFDLCQTQVRASRTVVGTSTNLYGTLQLGPDGKIYCAKNSATMLGMIAQPEAAGTACTYRDQGLSLMGKTSTYGLNNLNASLFYRAGLAFSTAPLCQGARLQVQGATTQCAQVPAPALAYSWSFGDAASGAANQATGQQAGHTYAQAGTYRVRLTATYGEATDTTTRTVTVSARPDLRTSSPTSGWCLGQRVITVGLPGGAPPSTLSYMYSGSITSVTYRPGYLTAQTPANGQAVLKLVGTNAAGCPSDTVTIRWQVNERPAPTPTGPAQICSGSPATVSVGAAPIALRWQVDSDTLAPASSRTFDALAEGPHTFRLLGGMDAARQTCYGASEPLTIRVEVPKAIRVLGWDSSFCPQDGLTMGAFSIELPAGDTARWQVQGGQITQGEGTGSIQVAWQGGTPGRVSVEARPVPACPPARFAAPVQERCLEVPNLITANNDGVNDYFAIRNIEGYPGNQVRLYDRQGRMLYNRSAFANQKESGPELTAGTYYYLVQIRTVAGERLMKGWLEVVR